MVFFAALGAEIALRTGFCGAGDILRSDSKEWCPASTAQSSGVKPLGRNVKHDIEWLKSWFL
jgi:hypothetical protein